MVCSIFCILMFLIDELDIFTSQRYKMISFIIFSIIFLSCSIGEESILLYNFILNFFCFQPTCGGSNIFITQHQLHLILSLYLQYQKIDFTIALSLRKFFENIQNQSHSIQSFILSIQSIFKKFLCLYVFSKSYITQHLFIYLTFKYFEENL